jgi:nitroimidazol reductase NimA-like FMN-containing flavoprotein (pyridoxamine 5'-phosphate oxidase superfamily)
MILPSPARENRRHEFLDQPGRARVIGILSPAEIEELLTRNTVGRLAMCSDVSPYIAPVNYAYDGSAIFGYSGPGRKIEIMRAQPNVALLIDEITGPTQWRSVIVEGVYEELTEPADRQQAMAALTGNNGPLVSKGLRSEPGVIVYRILPTTKTGRFERRDA